MVQTVAKSCDALNDYPGKLCRTADDALYSAYLGSGFSDTLAWVARAMGLDATRPMLHCVQLDNDCASTLVATDGHRMHFAPLSPRLPNSQGSINIPADAVKACLMLRGDVYLRAMVNGTYAVSGNNGTVAFAPSDAAFPPWSQGAPPIDGAVVAVKLSSGQVKEWAGMSKLGVVKLRVNGVIEATREEPSLKLTLSGDKSWADENATHDTAIGVNAKYLADAITEAGSLRIALPLDPIRFDGEHGRVAVIMPCRL